MVRRRDLVVLCGSRPSLLFRSFMDDTAGLMTSHLGEGPSQRLTSRLVSEALRPTSSVPRPSTVSSFQSLTGPVRVTSQKDVGFRRRQESSSLSTLHVRGLRCERFGTRRGPGLSSPLPGPPRSFRRPKEIRLSHFPNLPGTRKRRTTRLVHSDTTLYFGVSFCVVYIGTGSDYD